MDTNVHKVARIEMTNRKSGRTFSAGEINADMLFKSYFSNTL
jgi:methenyltetrahydromethanopterin cyclohydrolase